MGRVISINGRISSGKDTVGLIIQYLVSQKNNFDKVDLETFKNWETKYKTQFSGWEVRKFAAKLKIIAGILLGDPDFTQNWEKGDKEYRNTWLPEWKMSRRQFLLDLGTKGLRENFHTDVHVISTFSDYREDMNWLVTDLRFPNEHSGSKNRGAITIRVNRHFSKLYPEKWQMYVREREGALVSPSEIRFVEWLRSRDTELFNIVSHPSETSLVAHPFDYEVDNNGTMEELISQVKEILRFENIL